MALKDLFYQTSVDKQFYIESDEIRITNEELYEQEFSLTESLCSETQLVFGSCESCKVSFKVGNVVDSLKGKWLTIKAVLNNSETFQFGKYKVESDVPSGNRNYRTITAYDAMNMILKKNVASWYENLIFPMSLREFRDSFFAYLGIEQIETSLVNDSMEIEKTITSDTLMGGDVVKSICEINGVFGHIDRSGAFEYVSLSSEFSEVIDEDLYLSSEYEDFTTKAIDTLQIRQEEGDVGVTVGNGSNIYVVQGNFLCYGKDTEELEIIANNLYTKITNIQYVPLKVTLPGLPHLTVGTGISVSTRQGYKNTYILERSLKGIQSLKDTFEAKGTLERNVTRPSLETQVQQLKGKSNVLTKSLEETRSEISNLEEETSTMLQQTSNSFNASIKSVEENLQASNDATTKELENIRKQLDLTATSEELKIEIQKERENGTDKIKTSTGYTFDDDGLHVGKSDSEMATSITEDGMHITRSGEEVLTANGEGVNAFNLHARTYLIIGDTSRFEDYTNENGELRTGCFWVYEKETEVTPRIISVTYRGGNVPVGTPLNELTGLIVRATYSDGTVKTVADYTLSGTIEEGNNTITVYYKGLTKTFTVVGINPATILLNISVVYSGGDVLIGTSLDELKGIVVTATYEDGSSKEVTEYTLSGSIEEGNNTITVTYEDKTAVFTVNGINGLTITKQPSNATATEGESATFSIEVIGSGVTYKWRYSDDGTSWRSIESDDSMERATYVMENVKTSWNGRLVKCEVTDVTGKTITSNIVTLTVKAAVSYIRAYYSGGSVPVGTPLNELNGVSVTAIFTDGKTATIRSTAYTLSGEILEGENIITVTHKEHTTTFTVVGIAESFDGLVVKTGTIVDSGTINTGLSFIEHFVLSVDSLTSTGLISLVFNTELDAVGCYCSSYSQWSKNIQNMDPSDYITINDGTLVYQGGTNMNMIPGATYTWIAVGIE